MKYSVTKLTTKSNSNINYIFEHYPKLLQKIKDPYFIKLLYTLIYKASNQQTDYTLNIEDNVTTTTEKGYFLPESIRLYIIEEQYTLYNLHFKIKGISINVKIYANKININRYIYFIKLILNMCANESTGSKKNFDITFYLTSFEKTKPTTTIDPEHINSGYCKSCGEVVIFRKEEWFKVFIHECFHLFCLDFNEVHIDFKEIFSVLFFIKSDFLFFESLVEFWARTINIAVVSYFTKKNISYEDFELLMEINLSIERLYSILQMKHILAGLNVSYEQMILGPCNYKETTNAFCYYVLPALLLSHYEQTMAWFVEHNQTLLQFTKNTEHVHLFYQYIRSIYKTPQFLKLLDKEHFELNNMNMCAFDIQF
jgi:hypothetical protein